VHYTPEWVGRKEQSIHLAHVASVSIDTNLLFSNVLIEASGGTAPVACHCQRKADAVRIEQPDRDYPTPEHPGGGAPARMADRFAHQLQELAGVGGERLDVAALAFGVDGVEGERAFARPGQAGHDHELLARDIDVDALEIVLAGAAHADEVVLFGHEA